MQRLMLRLDSLVTRRRRWILAAWVLALAVALPFAAKQSDHLSGGGFDVPGSQSDAVAKAVAEFGAERTALAVVVIGDKADLETVRREAAGVDRVEGVGAPTRRDGVTLIPLRVDADDDDANDVAVDLREALGVGSGNGVHLAGQGALWAGLQQISKDDLKKAEQIGFPLVLLILLAVFGSLSAALLPL